MNSDLMNKWVEAILRQRHTHLEQLAAAFLAKSGGLDPREAVLCEETTNTKDRTVTRWWFEKRGSR